MEKIQCIILDDDLAYCERIASCVNGHKQLESAGVFTSPEKAGRFLMENSVPLIFIDMEMPGITGIDFLSALSYKPYAIIISGHPGFAVKAFELDALDYMLKPFSTDRFYTAVNRAIEHIELTNKASDAPDKMIPHADDYFFVRSEQKFIKLHCRDVLYIEALENFVRIYLKGQDKPTTTLINLKQIENTLSSSVFIRIHKSYIVNMNHITSLSGEHLMLGHKMIPIGPSYKNMVEEKVMGNKVIRR
jgi:DNA-binding LytR/AlgR family response regulator